MAPHFQGLIREPTRPPGGFINGEGKRGDTSLCSGDIDEIYNDEKKKVKKVGKRKEEEEVRG